MPRDSAPTRSAILAAALQTLRGDGLDDFSIATVAQGAAVPKGLVLYHFRSRQQLLASCGKAIAEERSRRLAGAQAGGGGGGPRRPRGAPAARAGGAPARSGGARGPGAPVTPTASPSRRGGRARQPTRH